MNEGSGERATRNDVLAVYEPKQASVKSAVIVITLLVLWGMFRVPGLLHGARAISLDFFAGVALLVFPITFGLWGGTRVELLADRVYAYRFGRLKHEYRLIDLVGSGTKYGVNGLHFRQGFVSGDPAFMSAAKARARELGVVIAPTVMQIGVHEATFELDQMCLDPDVCVGCGTEPARLRAFLAWQGVELVATRFILARNLKMPVCGPCDPSQETLASRPDEPARPRSAATTARAGSAGSHHLARSIDRRRCAVPGRAAVPRQLRATHC